ncbi:MAG: UvrD-helicase domain-containing protein [bacterium]|nr:UvrD-helicase domain-containing protein [bacterium]
MKPLLAESLVEGLNPEQRAAIECIEGPLLVLAGAGSGKTRVLTHRIAYLIGACGIPPEGILAVTFTNKAAGEMRDRVEKLLGPEAQGLWLSTFHSTCVRILRREIGQLGRERGFVIYDQSDALGVVKEAMRRHSLDPKNQDARRLGWSIDQWKNAGWLPAEAAEKANDLDAEQAAEIYATYQKLLAEANALDFGDLLLLTVELFERYPDVLRHYQECWQYVMVDEYQDTNRVQYQLVQQLVGPHRNLCVVGDPDQSVYGWRGADIRNILDFERDFPDAQVVKLERNYRSTQRILAGADAVVDNNPDRPPKKMIAEGGEGDPIILYQARDERDEAAYVVRRILEGVKEGDRAYGQHAVFYRTNAQSRPVEEELLKYDVPYVVVGGVRFYDRAEVKDALSYLRLAQNPRDDMALRRIVNRPPRGIGKTTMERAAAVAEARTTSLLDGLRTYAEESGGRVRTKVAEFLRLVNDLAEGLPHWEPADAISAVLDKTGIVRGLEKEATPEAESRVENLRELIASAEDFEAANRGPEDEGRSLVELFLDQVALVSDLDSAEMRDDRVSLMTAHSAKGLEFPVVFVLGMEEGVFPHQGSMRDERAVEEERRLCYVAMTRAMEELTLAHALERRRFGTRTFGTVSRFLREVPQGLVEEVGSSVTTRSMESEGRGYDYSYDQTAPEDGESGSAGATAGGRVRHPVFGAGTIQAVMGRGPGQKLRIRFDHAGVKTVVVRYANLEPA